MIYLDKYGEPVGIPKLLWKMISIINPAPNLAYILEVSAKISYQRILMRNDGVVQESQETIKRRKKMLEKFLPEDITRINAALSPETIFTECWQSIEELI